MTKNDELSMDAKRIAAAFFGMGGPGKSKLRLHMRESVPTERSQAALDELVAAGAISRHKFNDYGSIEYVNEWDMTKMFQGILVKMMAGEFDDDPFPLTQPVDGA